MQYVGAIAGAVIGYVASGGNPYYAYVGATIGPGIGGSISPGEWASGTAPVDNELKLDDLEIECRS